MQKHADPPICLYSCRGADGFTASRSHRSQLLSDYIPPSAEVGEMEWEPLLGGLPLPPATDRSLDDDEMVWILPNRILACKQQYSECLILTYGSSHHGDTSSMMRGFSSITTSFWNKICGKTDGSVQKSNPPVKISNAMS